MSGLAANDNAVWTPRGVVVIDLAELTVLIIEALAVMRRPDCATAADVLRNTDPDVLVPANRAARAVSGYFAKLQVDAGRSS